MAKIRVGMIRCDLHAIYYANIIQRHDPLVLRELQFGKGGYFYFYTEYLEQEKFVIPRVAGFEVTMRYSHLAPEHLHRAVHKLYLVPSSDEDLT